MRRWERPILLFSLAVNIAFVSIAATHIARDRGRDLESPPPPPQREQLEPRREIGELRDRHARRRARMARVLALDADQRRAWDASFDHLAPELRDLRREAWRARAAYRAALLRGDAEAARHATREVSRAQAAVDSVCAEAMWAETATLRPEQRTKYVQWTLRAEGARAARRPRP